MSSLPSGSHDAVPAGRSSSRQQKAAAGRQGGCRQQHKQCRQRLHEACMLAKQAHSPVVLTIQGDAAIAFQGQRCASRQLGHGGLPTGLDSNGDRAGDAGRSLGVCHCQVCLHSHSQTNKHADSCVRLAQLLLTTHAHTHTCTQQGPLQAHLIGGSWCQRSVVKGQHGCSCLCSQRYRAACLVEHSPLICEGITRGRVRVT